MRASCPLAISAIFLSLLLLSGLGCGSSGEEQYSAEGEEASSHEGHGHGEDGEGGSDLDLPVAELLEAECEHGIHAYECDECRYEVGFVKASESLFDPSEDGLLKLHDVSTEKVSAGRDLTGEVHLNEEKSVYLSPTVEGVVRRIRVDLGSSVKAGQILYEVDSSGYREAQAAYVRAAAEFKLAKATLEREEDLYERGICPEKDLLEARAGVERAGAERAASGGSLRAMGLVPGDLDRLTDREPASGMDYLPVRAPFAGTILDRALHLGGMVSPGDPLLLLADTREMWVLTRIYEREMGAVLESGTVGFVPAEVRVDAYPDRVFSGVVERIGGTMDEATRTVQARVVVDNPDSLLRAGMFARVKLLLPSEDRALAVPREAVLEDEGRSFVFLHHDGPYFVRRPLEAGREWGGWVEVLSGLDWGERIVTEGAFLLKSDVLRSKMGAGCAD